MHAEGGELPYNCLDIPAAEEGGVAKTVRPNLVRRGRSLQVPVPVPKYAVKVTDPLVDNFLIITNQSACVCTCGDPVSPNATECIGQFALVDDVGTGRDDPNPTSYQKIQYDVVLLPKMDVMDDLVKETRHERQCLLMDPQVRYRQKEFIRPQQRQLCGHFRNLQFGQSSRCRKREFFE
jgi:hypothetical protein